MFGPGPRLPRIRSRSIAHTSIVAAAIIAELSGAHNAALASLRDDCSNTCPGAFVRGHLNEPVHRAIAVSAVYCS
jgi:hypothetical protein